MKIDKPWDLEFYSNNSVKLALVKLINIFVAYFCLSLEKRKVIKEGAAQPPPFVLGGNLTARLFTFTFQSISCNS